MSIHGGNGPDHWSSNEIRVGMCPDGPWVQLSDYAALQSRLDACQLELAEVKVAYNEQCLATQRAVESEVAAIDRVRKVQRRWVRTDANGTIFCEPNEGGGVVTYADLEAALATEVRAAIDHQGGA